MNEKNKTAAKKAVSRGARKPNTTTDKNEKMNRPGKGTRSQANKAKKSGVGKSGAKKVPRRELKQNT